MTQNMTNQSLAIIHADGTYYGVACREVAGQRHLTHARMDADFTAANTAAAHKRFTAELFSGDRSVENAPQPDQTAAYTFGFDTPALLCYRIEIPDVPAERLDAIIRLRQESILPLPVAKMATDWTHDAEAATLVAARHDQAQAFLDKISESQPRRIRLVAEGAARAWAELRPPANAGQAFFAWWHGDTFELLQTDGGKLRHRLALRIHRADLSGPQAADYLQSTAADLQQLVQRMGAADAGAIPCVTGEVEPDPLLSQLIAAGAPFCQTSLAANALTRDWDAPARHTVFPGIGLALLEAEDAAGFDLVRESYRPNQATRPRRTSRSLLLPGMALLCALALNVGVAYRSDLAKWRALQFEPAVEAEIVDQIQDVELRERIAAGRPDLLRLLEAVTPEKQSNLHLNRITYRQGQPVRLTGVAKKDGHLAFLEALLQQEDLSDVRMENPTYDKKKKETRFTLSFHFRHWTKPQASATSLLSR